MSHNATPHGPVVRHAARALLLDGRDRVLMLACIDPTREDAERFWITPGGGLKQGETHDTALRRELREELGITAANLTEIGPWVWHRVITFRWLGRTLQQHERFRLLRVDRAELDFAGRSEDEHKALTDHHWFTTDELRDLEDKVAPTRLPDLLDDLLRYGPPAESIDVGV
ncbi:MAG: NUDIX hydrolase [Phycisphaeraceae bacterium]